MADNPMHVLVVTAPSERTARARARRFGRVLGMERVDGDRWHVRVQQNPEGSEMTMPIPNRGPLPTTRKWLAQAITRRGKLGGKGFLSKSVAEQKRILDGCVAQYGYRSCLGSIMVLERIPATSMRFSTRLMGLRNYLVSKYGGQGSFGPRMARPGLRKGRKKLKNPAGEFTLIPELTDNPPITCRTNAAWEREMEAAGNPSLMERAEAWLKSRKEKREVSKRVEAYEEQRRQRKTAAKVEYGAMKMRGQGMTQAQIVANRETLSNTQRAWDLMGEQMISGKGEVTTTYDELVSTFGKPTLNEPSEDLKTTVEWWVIFPDGTLATIYDWKGLLYEKGEATRAELTAYQKANTRWDIGGNDKKAVTYVRAALRLARGRPARVSAPKKAKKAKKAKKEKRKNPKAPSVSSLLRGL